MTRLKFSLFVVILLMGPIQGAPWSTVSRKSSCSWWKYVRDDMKCMPQVTYFVGKFLWEFGDDLETSTKLFSMRDSCISVQKCLDSTECTSLEMLNDFNDVCDGLLYLTSSSFIICTSKIDATPDNCENGGPCEPFGVGNCRKRQITNACGQAEWIKFRDNMLKIHRLGKENEKCYFNYLENL